MTNKIFFVVIAVCLMIIGINIYKGGFYSVKHKMFIEYGDYNHLIGGGFVFISVVIVLLLWKK